MWTIAKPGRGKVTERRSRFLAFAYPVGSEGDAKSLVDDARKRYRDARHVAYAYRILEGGTVRERADDAGEPSRSAGWPILELLRRKNLVNVLVVVVRYFGGVKLGVGNLRRAYRDAAALALEDAGKAGYVPMARLLLSVDPEHSGRLFALIANLGGRVLSQGLDGTRFTVSVELPESEVEGLLERLRPWAEAKRLE